MSGNQQQWKQDAGKAANSTIIGSSGIGGSSKSSPKPFPQDASTIGIGNFARMSSGGASNSSGGGKIAKKKIIIGVGSSAGLSAAIAMNNSNNANSIRSPSSYQQQPTATVTPIRPALANTAKHNCNVAATATKASAISTSNSGTEGNDAFFLSSALKTKSARASSAAGVAIGIGGSTNPIIPGGVGGGGGRRRHPPGKQQQQQVQVQQLVPTAVPFRSPTNMANCSAIVGSSSSGITSSGDVVGNGYGIIGSGCAGSNSVSTPNKTTKVATLKLSTQSPLYSSRANNTSSSIGNGACTTTATTTTATNITTTTTTTPTTRQLQWFTPIKQNEKGKSTTTTKSNNHATISTCTSIATPTTVATTPSHSSSSSSSSSSVLGNSFLLCGGSATPGGGDGGGGGCFLSSICSIDNDETATRTTATSNARSILGRSGTTPKIPAVVTSISSISSTSRSSIVSPLPVLSDITNKDGSADGSGNTNNGTNNDGFITPRKADRNSANSEPPTPSSSSTKDTRSTGPASPSVTPPPQNLKGDPRRQSKVKTELCLYYLKDVPCPFGERCNYAHGWDELRFKKLKDLERNGLIPNASQYRTHPCLSWITTGSCPFGQRCSSIHDPRVAGPTSSWMPYADSPVPNLETTVNVEKFYHRHASSLHASNPLVGQVFWEKCRPSTFSARTNGGSSKKGCFGAGTVGKPQPPIGSHANGPWGAREWKDTYGLLVCNLDALRSPSSKPSPPASSYTLMSKSSFATALATASTGDSSGSSSTNGGAGANASAGKKLTEEQRLSIALLMSGGKYMSDQEDYIYSPPHLVYGELCMILQTRYFRLVSADDAPKPASDASSDTLGIDGLNSVREISIDEYNASRTPWDNRCSYSPKSTMVVRKICFGPCGEANANMSIWFDIPSSQISPCTPPMVKRLKRVRSKAQMLNGNKRKGSSSPPFPPLPFHATAIDRTSPNVEESFHTVTHQPFFYSTVVNNDPVARDLVRDILLHRIRTLRGNDLALALANEERVLRGRYFSLKRSMEKWQWPSCEGRGPGRVDENTKVPECTAKYSLPYEFGNTCSDNCAVAPVWGSFLNASQKGHVEPDTNGSFDLSFGGTLTQFGRPRLAIFRFLIEGISVPESKWDTPLVRGDFTLLDGGKDGVGSWEEVKEHYLGESKSCSETPSPGKRPNALPLGSNGEKRDSIFVKINNASQ